MIGRANTDRFEEQYEHGSARRTIDIIITINGDALAFFDGPLDARHGFGHVVHQKRVMQPIECGAKKLPRRLEGLNASRYEDSSDALWYIDRFRQFACGFVHARLHGSWKTPAVTHK